MEALWYRQVYTTLQLRMEHGNSYANYRGACRGESIADHMYRMSLISMFAPVTLRPRLDIPKCIKMSLVHDMAELIVGDITPVDGVAKPEKNRREAATMDYLTGPMLRNMPGGAADGEELRAVWQEYEDSKTLDSQFVHDVDKLELLLQMMEYERAAKRRLDLGEFTYVASVVVLPEMQAWANEVIREREEFWGGVKHESWETEQEGGISAESKKGRDEYYGQG